jgi:trans-2,3-dihydro-3-hydroxyanthranilate isomerase
MKLPFATVDVFTAERFGGNPLAVVLDGRDLSAAQMQHIAADFNYSETTFVLPPQDPTHTARVRIFTPRAEVPFAGHPNVGTAFVLAQVGQVFGRPIGDQLQFEEQAGLVEVELLTDQDQVVGARLRSPAPFQIIETVAPEGMAASCGFDVKDVMTGNHPPCVVTAGLPFAIAEAASRKVLSAAAPRDDDFAEHFPSSQTAGVFLYCLTPGNDVDVHVRMFAPKFDVREDPATGSANVALVGLRASLKTSPDLA